MPWLLPLSVLAAVAALAMALHLRQRAARRRARQALRATWGRPKRIDRDFALIASYHRARVGSTADRAASIDARTWQDLDLDAVFAYVDRTSSAVGRQTLYHFLRATGRSRTDLAAFDCLVEAMRGDEALRLDVQTALGSLDLPGMHWLWSLAFDPIPSIPRWAAIYPVFALSMGALVAVGLAVAPQVLLVAVFGLLAGFVLRAFGRRLVPFNEPFRDMGRLLGAADRLAAMERLPAATLDALHVRLPRLRRLRRSAAWLTWDVSTGGDLSGLLIEYLNMLLCLDVNAAMFGVRQLRRHQDDLHAVFEAVGTLDAAISVASVRDGAERQRSGSGGWSRPEFQDEAAPARFDDLRHPLLEHAVANSVTLGQPAGLLVTGANMTGKSTFLRTIGVNVVLAQSVNTVFASAYRAPWLSVASCITPSDDLQAGKSYYQVEVETLVAMLAAPAASGRALYLFDELFRGTNTLDRIGAATAVLRYLVRTGLVVAATHDLELVSLLADYAVVHFADELTPAGLHFDYVLRPGPTTTRNAIALLGVLGAPPQVVSEALAEADRVRAMRPATA